MPTPPSDPRKTRIFFTYKHISEPWGGTNNFVRSLHSEIINQGDFEFAGSLEDDYDIVFMNQLALGPGNGSRKIELDRIKTIKNWARQCGSPRRLIVRAVNLKQHSDRPGIRAYLSYLSRRAQDGEIIDLLHLADLVIFQSNYQKSVFSKYGYRGTKDTVIHNGADHAFLGHAIHPKPMSRTIRFVSSGTNRFSKRHDLIAALSEIPGVEVIHLGGWPDNVRTRKVVCKGMVTSKEMVEVYRDAHYFFFPAVLDMCPNSVVEAISVGLPVIYNPGPGSSREIVGDNGMSLDEDDLAATVEEARDRYASLVDNVRKNQGYYSITRASSEYLKAFRNSCNLRG